MKFASTLRTHKTNSIVQFIYIVIIGIFLVVNAAHLYKGGILFNEDIARDFIILDELVSTKKLTLIGPKTGIVPGLFHGPLWYYVNAPVFFLSDGDPHIVGIYWYCLYVAGVLLFGYLCNKIAGDETALVAIILLLGISAFMPSRMWQESMSFLLSFLYFYLLYEYASKVMARYLIWAWLILGMIIQSQMAFGLPILISSILYVIFQVSQNKRWKHLATIVVLIIPFSTFILFECRHDLLQTRSTVNYISNQPKTDHLSIPTQRLRDRAISIVESFKPIRFQYYAKLFGPIAPMRVRVLEFAGGILGIAALLHLQRKRDSFDQNIRRAWDLSSWILITYWILTVPFPQSLPWYYFESLIPIICFWWAYLFVRQRNNLIVAVVLVSIGMNVLATGLYAAVRYALPISFHGDWQTHWDYYRTKAEFVARDSGNRDFGYYTWAETFYAYQIKYAMLFVKKSSPQQMHSFSKQPLTYLIIEPEDSRREWGDPYFWTRKQIGISRTPDKSITFEDGYQIWRYELSPEEIATPADPNLDARAHFR